MRIVLARFVAAAIRLRWFGSVRFRDRGRIAGRVGARDF